MLSLIDTMDLKIPIKEDIVWSETSKAIVHIWSLPPEGAQSMYLDAVQEEILCEKYGDMDPVCMAHRAFLTCGSPYFSC